MLVTNETTADLYFGPLHLGAGVGTQLVVDDTSATSLYLTSDLVADALNNAYNSGKITVTGAADPFPRPTGDPQFLHGSGTPEGLVFAPHGTIYLRRDGVQTNGGVIYTKTTGVTDSTGWVDIATASGATALLPAGTIAAFAGATAPSGWLLCDGSAISRTVYSVLFSAISTAYGAGDGSTTFNLPDLRGRIPTGVGTHSDVAGLGNSDGLSLASRTPKHNTTLTGSPALSGSPGLTGAPDLTGAPALTGAPGISDPGHTHTNPGVSIFTTGATTGFLTGSGSHWNSMGSGMSSDTTGISATIGSLAANKGTLAGTIGSLAATIGSLAANIGSLFAGAGGTRPMDTPAYQTVNYIIKT